MVDNVEKQICDVHRKSIEKSLSDGMVSLEKLMNEKEKKIDYIKNAIVVLGISLGIFGYKTVDDAKILMNKKIAEIDIKIAEAEKKLSNIAAVAEKVEKYKSDIAANVNDGNIVLSDIMKIKEELRVSLQSTERENQEIKEIKENARTMMLSIAQLEYKANEMSKIQPAKITEINLIEGKTLSKEDATAIVSAIKGVDTSKDSDNKASYEQIYKTALKDYAKGNYKDAANKIDEAIKIDGIDNIQKSKAIYNKAIFVAADNRFHDAIKLHDEVINTWKDTNEESLAVRVAMSMAAKAALYSVNNYYEKEISEYDAIIKMHQNNVWGNKELNIQAAKALYLSGQAYEKMGKAASAIAMYSQAVNKFTGMTKDQEILKYVELSKARVEFIQPQSRK